MNENPLRKLESFGQSIWLDYLSRNAIGSGQLQHLIDEDGLTGVTSNPSIFEKAIAETRDYETDIARLAHEGKSVEEIGRALMVTDIQNAADLFRPVYTRTDARDGFVSLEVSPHLVHDTEGTIKEARQLWKAVDRPNVFIKVPGTIEGVPAVRQLISEGINVNITLLFSLNRYRKVAEAYVEGLDLLVAKGQAPRKVASVASFFLSRIDTLVDSELERLIKAGGEKAGLAKNLRGHAAIACAKMARGIYEQVFAEDRFGKFSMLGARTQKLLWASTSTKNPNYPDLKYVESLIGPDTINTLPLETLEAYRDHGQPARRLSEGLPQAKAFLQEIAEVGIDLENVSEQLEEDGAKKFSKAFDQMMQAVEKRRAAALTQRIAA